MIITINISGTDYYINDGSILYVYDNSGLELVLCKDGYKNSPVWAIFESNVANAVTSPSYAAFVTTTASNFLEVRHLTLSNVCINASKVLKLEEIDASNTTVLFDNNYTVDVNENVVSLQSALDALLISGSTGIPGGGIEIVMGGRMDATGGDILMGSRL